MLTEQFVSFETAKLLKEKGFDEYCAWQYYTYWEDEELKNYEHPIHNEKVLRNSQMIGKDNATAPTLQMARQWLDETYDVRIFILPARDTDNYMCHVYVVWKINKSSGDFEEVYMSGFYEDYDVCMEGAIDYCVESLI